MIFKVFTVYDSKAGAYLSPFMFSSKGEALRAFVDAVNDEKSLFYKHPEDYTLFEIATFDNISAKYDSLLTPLSMGVAVEFKNEG